MYLAHLNPAGAKVLTKAMATEFQPGMHVFTNVNTGEFLSHGWIEDIRPVELGAIEEGRFKNILFVRSGGFGDVLFLTPTLKALTDQGHQVFVACFPEYATVLENLPFRVHHVTYPIPQPIFEDFSLQTSGQVIDLEGVIEGNNVLHAVDALANAAGVVLAGNEAKECHFVLSSAELATARDRYPRISTETKRLGIQVQSSALCRTYPYSALVYVIRMAMEEGWRIFLFGDPGSLEDPPEDVANEMKVVNLTRQEPPLSFRDSAAVLATCDVVFAPDSALTHVAGALHLPTVAVYGPFHWRQRTAYAPTVRVLQGHAECAPCHHHVRGGQDWPEGGPCNTTGYCVAFQKVPPARILAEINKAYSATASPNTPTP